MKKALKILLFMILGIVYLGMMIGGCEDTPQAAKAPEPEHDDLGAFIMSQKFVKKNLKSPSTAKFPLLIDEGVKVEHQGEGKYYVRAYVDSQNGFGAMLRTKYMAEVEYLGSDEWQLKDLQIVE